MKNFVYTIVYDDRFYERICNDMLQVGDQFLIENDMVVITSVKLVNKVVTSTEETHYICITCDKIVEVDKSLVGVTQVKIISPNFGGKDAAKAIEDALNEWLFETRHTHFVMDITYMQFGVAIKYRLRNEVDQRRYKATEMSYKKSGETIKYQGRVFQNEVSQSCVIF